MVKATKWILRAVFATALPALPPGWEEPVRFLQHFLWGGGKPLQWDAPQEVLEAALNGFLRANIPASEEAEGRYVTTYGDYPWEVTFHPLSGWGHLEAMSPAMCCVGGFSVLWRKEGESWLCRLWDRYDWDEIINQKVPACLVPLVEKLPQSLRDWAQVYRDGSTWKFRRDWNRFGTPFVTEAAFRIGKDDHGWYVESTRGKFRVNRPIGVYTRYYPALRQRAQEAYQRFTRSAGR